MIADKHLKELAVLIKLKSIYVSGCVHNYSPFKLAKSSSLSRNTIKKHVEFFLKNGYARMEGLDLVFTNLLKVDKKYKYGTIKIDTSLPIKKMQVLFHREIILDQVRKFKYLQSIKEDSTQPTGPDALKKLKKALKALKSLGKGSEKLPNASAKYSVSIKRLSKHFNCSVGKTQGIINSLCEDNLMKRITDYRIVETHPFRKGFNKHYLAHRLESVKGSWYSGNTIFQRKTNIYVF